MNDDFVQLTWKMMPLLAKNVKREGEKWWEALGGNTVALCWGCCVKYVFLMDFPAHEIFVFMKEAWIYRFSCM